MGFLEDVLGELKPEETTGEPGQGTPPPPEPGDKGSNKPDKPMHTYGPDFDQFAKTAHGG